VQKFAKANAAQYVIMTVDMPFGYWLDADLQVGKSWLSVGIS
jgi:hypothetical protein